MPDSRLTVPLLTCQHCGVQYPSLAYQSRYCTLRCKQAAATKRRRMRETGILAPLHGAPAAPVNMAEVDRLAREIQARNEGRELTSDDAPPPSQTVLEELGFKAPRPVNPASTIKSMEEQLLEQLEKKE